MTSDLIERTAEAPRDSGLALLSERVMKERDLAGIATVDAQALRYETFIENMSQGVCFFGGDGRLILCNRRYAEIYRLAPEQVRPGATLREILERRIAVGSCAMAVDDYLEMAATINSSAGPKIWTAELKDGRTIQIDHQPLPDGGWVSTHEDITELKATRAVANVRFSLQTLIDWVPDYLWVKDADSRFIIANKAVAFDSGRTRTSDMIGLTDFDLHAPEAAREFRALEQEILRSGQPMVDREEFVIDGWGNGRWLSSTKVPLRNDQNEVFGLVGIARDITERKLADALRDGQAQILELIATNAPLEDVLEHLLHLIESQIPGIFASAQLLDEDGTRLRHAAAPSFTDSWIEALDGGRVGSTAGSNGAAVYRRETVIVADILNDPLWEEYRDLAASHGYRSCWSTPILSHKGAVLGVLSIYSAKVREPNEAETRLIHVAARIAAIAIERK